jgi:hypothetical protein
VENFDAQDGQVVSFAISPAEFGGYLHGFEERLQSVEGILIDLQHAVLIMRKNLVAIRTAVVAGVGA